MEQYWKAAFDAVVEVATEAVVAGFGAVEDAQHDARARGRELRDGATMQALLGGPALKLAAELTGAVTASATARFEAYRLSPTHGRAPLIDELEDAEAGLNKAIAIAASSPSALHLFVVPAAIIRLRAITAALGPECVADPFEPGSGGAYPRRRRRTIDAADVPAAVATSVLGMAERGDDWRDGLADLRAIEATPANVGGIVTKIVALADLPEGRGHVNAIAGAIRAARFKRVVKAGEPTPPVSRPAVATPAVIEPAAPAAPHPVAPAVAASPSPAVAWPPVSGQPRIDAAAARRLLGWLAEKPVALARLYHLQPSGQVRLTAAPVATPIAAMFEAAIDYPEVQAALASIVKTVRAA